MSQDLASSCLYPYSENPYLGKAKFISDHRDLMDFCEDTYAQYRFILWPVLSNYWIEGCEVGYKAGLADLAGCKVGWESAFANARSEIEALRHEVEALRQVAEQSIQAIDLTSR